ncbi:MAG TPA: dockerin type I domain-containing protein [Pirellulales bacterium]|jgi:hypothetical protein|nr:dockerin type I domain-containing protein [Pirellulales bacterium]
MRARNRERLSRFEPLQDRAMLSASAIWNSATATLSISGDDSGDTITVGSATSGNVQVIANGSDISPLGVPASSVKLIDAQGGAGNDTISLAAVSRTNFPFLEHVTINGNGGNNTLIGSNLSGPVLTDNFQLIAGDVNGDGQVDVRDLIALMTALTNRSAYLASFPHGMLTESDFLYIADINRDGAVTNTDAQALIDVLISGTTAQQLSDDNISGGADNDWLDGGAGNDYLAGNGGSNTYSYSWVDGTKQGDPVQPPLGNDTIDSTGNDTLDLSAFHVTDYTPPNLSQLGSNTISSVSASALTITFQSGVPTTLVNSTDLVEDPYLASIDGGGAGNDETLLYEPNEPTPTGIGRDREEGTASLVAINSICQTAEVFNDKLSGVWAIAPEEPSPKVAFQVATPGLGIGVGIDAEGNFDVAWNDLGDGRITRYDALGHQIGTTIEFGHGIESFAMQGENLDSQSDDDFVIAWTEEDDNLNSQVFVQRFHGDGTPIDENPLQASTGNNSHGSPTVAMSRDGDFVVAYGSNIGSQGGICARYFDATKGQFVSDSALGNSETIILPPTTFDDLAVYGVSSPTVAIDSSGRFVVTWVQEESFTNFQVLSQAFTIAGSNAPIPGRIVDLGHQVVIADTSDGSLQSPTVAMNDDPTGERGSYYVVAWTEQGETIEHVMARAVPTGNQFTSTFGPFQVDQLPWSVGAEGSPIAMNKQGNFIIGFYAGTSLPDSYGVDEVTGLDYQAGSDYRTFSPFTVNVTSDLPLITGDTDGNHIVDYTDYRNIVDNFGQASVAGVPYANVDGLNGIDVDDYFILLDHYGETDINVDG